MAEQVRDVVARFAEHRAATPDAIAVVGDRVRLSYAELAAVAGRNAAGLAGHGAGPEEVVAVLAERGPCFVGMVLGVLTAGAAYLPIEPDIPIERARQMCAAAGVRIVLVQPGHETLAAELAAAVVVATEELTVDAGPDLVERPAHGLAYVIFTSGSTGTPKGAMVTNDGMANHIAAKEADLRLSATDVVGLTAPLSFDISVWQTLAPLAIGGRVAVGSAADLAEPTTLIDWVRGHGVTVLEIVPSFLAVILDELADRPELRAGLRSLRHLVATGEALPGALVRRWYADFPDITLVNAYGPTECSDDVTHHLVDPADGARDWPPIGREIRDTRLYVLDAQGAEVPDGAEGELLVRGRGVGRGYIGDPVRTALAFVPDHLSGVAGGRLYRTGDRGRRAADGTLDYLGRRDRQVKISGHRIELGEVEAQLLRIPEVGAAACVVSGGKLCGFVTVRSTKTAEQLLGQLRALVPSWLVPRQLTVLDRIPLNRAGKADLRALAQLSPDRESVASQDSAEPVPDIDAVRALVAEALDVVDIGPDEQFFAAGGDSLGAMRLLAAARRRFGAPGASLREFLVDPTPRGLLATIDAARSAPEPPAETEGGSALSSGQERLWFLEQLNRGKDPLLIHLDLALHGEVDVAGLRHALTALVRRHQPLRTVFSSQSGVPVATVRPTADIVLHLDEDGADPALSARTSEPPLMTARLRTLAPGHHVLTLVLHHLVADGWSLAVLEQELGWWYRRWLAGDTEITELDTSFGRYVADERAWLAGDDAAECVRYWTGQLAGAHYAMRLPMDRPKPAKPDFTTASVVHELSTADTTALGKIARAADATPFMVVMAAFYAVLADLTGQSDLVLGIDAVNRSWPGSEQLIGTFVNQLPVRLASTDAEPTFTDLLDLTRRQCLGAYAHERLPFHKIVAAVNPPRKAGQFPLFQVKLTHQTAWRHDSSLPGLKIEPKAIPDPVMDADLMLDMSGEFDRLRLELLYLPQLLDDDTADAWLAAVTSVLCAAAASPDGTVETGLKEVRR